MFMISGEKIDLFSMWMILEDISKSSEYLNVNTAIVNDMKLALDIVNTELFKEAWKIWSPAVVQSESDFTKSFEISRITEKFNLDFTSLQGYYYYYFLIVDLQNSIENKLDVEMQDLLCDLSQMFETGESSSSIVEESLVNIRKKVDKVTDESIVESVNFDVANTFNIRKQLCANLILLLSVNLKEPIIMRDVMKWASTMVIYKYRLLITRLFLIIFTNLY